MYSINLPKHPHSVEEKRWDMGPTIETNGRDHWTTVPAGGSTPVVVCHFLGGCLPIQFHRDLKDCMNPGFSWNGMDDYAT